MWFHEPKILTHLCFAFYLVVEPSRGFQSHFTSPIVYDQNSRPAKEFQEGGQFSRWYNSARLDSEFTKDRGFGLRAGAPPFPETVCIEDSDCVSNITRGFTCNADVEGQLGNCSCPEFMPVLLPDKGSFQCYKVGNLLSPCERVEQCGFTNQYLQCEGGFCICPANITVKLGFKCMPARPLHSNCTTTDSCSDPFTVCKDGRCTCRIYYSERDNACVYTGEATWKIICMFAFPALIAIAIVIFLALASWEIIREQHVRDESGTSSTSIILAIPLLKHGVQQRDTTSLLSESRSEQDPRGGAAQPKVQFPFDANEGYKGRDHANKNPRVRPIKTETTPKKDLCQNVEIRRFSYPGSGTKLPGADPDFLLKYTKPMATDDPVIETRQRSQDPYVTVAPLVSSSCPRFGPVVKMMRRSHSNPNMQTSKSGQQEDPQRRTSKTVRIGAQEISRTVTYVPCAVESNNVNGATGSTPWLPLDDDVFVVRFPKIAAPSRRSIDDALRTVVGKNKSRKEVHHQGEALSKDVCVEDSLLSLEELGLTSADFPDTANSTSALELPQLGWDALSKRFPQLAQLDLPACADPPNPFDI
ncbi:uncharacterized protein LOC135400848 [Ornithodoros turicata]|uniref:uncharacterized protein LOC135400848 n=1 Tax=Ornithodoros turicata TaxID=34597 RepID=UPI00313A4B79